jgi:hypothetical protein
MTIIYVVATNRADGRMPGPEKVCLWTTCPQEAERHCTYLRDTIGPHYGIYEATVVIEGRIDNVDGS